MVDETRRVYRPHGASFEVRSGGALDAIYSDSEPAEPHPVMPLSLGILGDLMWLQLPDSRVRLAKLIVNEVEAAVQSGLPLCVLVGSIVTDVLWHPLIQPALDNYPETRMQVQVYLRVVREAYLRDESPTTGTRWALEEYVFDNLKYSPYREIVEEVDMELAEIIGSAEQS